MKRKAGSLNRAAGALVVHGSSNGYLKTVCDYVHLNPARARLDPGLPLRFYPWSSWPEYVCNAALAALALAARRAFAGRIPHSDGQRCWPTVDLDLLVTASTRIRQRPQNLCLAARTGVQ